MTTLRLLALLAIAPASLHAQSSDEKAVLATVDKIFVAMTARDTAASRALILPGGYFYSTREGKTRVQSDTSYINSLARGTDKLLERIYEPKVLIHKEMATVWARYDFFVNDKRTHCGVDSFTFLRTDTGWRMANVSYNVELTGCP
jgi:hypothetical protein